MLFGYQLPELKNIINFFQWKNIFTIQERDDIELSMGTLIDNFIEGDVLGFSNPHFEFNLKEYVFTNMLMSLSEVIYADNISMADNKSKTIHVPLKTQLEEELEKSSVSDLLKADDLIEQLMGKAKKAGFIEAFLGSEKTVYVNTAKGKINNAYNKEIGFDAEFSKAVYNKFAL
jgi:hypothetical protein